MTFCVLLRSRLSSGILVGWITSPFLRFTIFCMWIFSRNWFASVPSGLCFSECCEWYVSSTKRSFCSHKCVDFAFLLPCVSLWGVVSALSPLICFYLGYFFEQSFGIVLFRTFLLLAASARVEDCVLDVRKLINFIHGFVSQSTAWRSPSPVRSGSRLPCWNLFLGCATERAWPWTWSKLLFWERARIVLSTPYSRLFPDASVHNYLFARARSSDSCWQLVDHCLLLWLFSFLVLRRITWVTAVAVFPFRHREICIVILPFILCC